MMYVPPPQSGNPGPAQIDPVQGIRTAQIICVALMMGLLTFLAITMIMPGELKPPMLAYIGLGLGIFQIGLRFVVPGLVVRSETRKLLGTEQDLNSRLFGIYQTKMIIGLALLEGAGFFNLVCYMTERQWWTLAFVGFLLLLMAMMFPTLSQFESWAEDVKRDQQNRF